MASASDNVNVKSREELMDQVSPGNAEKGIHYEVNNFIYKKLFYKV